MEGYSNQLVTQNKVFLRIMKTKEKLISASIVIISPLIESLEIHEILQTITIV